MTSNTITQQAKVEKAVLETLARTGTMMNCQELKARIHSASEPEVASAMFRLIRHRLVSADKHHAPLQDVLAGRVYITAV